MTDFERFQKTFKEYQKKFGLTGYKCYFKNVPLEDVYASVITNHIRHVATVKLNSELDCDAIPFKDVKRTAKHEAIHLLLSRIEDNARKRYVSEEEIIEAIEELVFKLEDLIP